MNVSVTDNQIHRHINKRGDGKDLDELIFENLSPSHRNIEDHHRPRNGTFIIYYFGTSPLFN